MKLFPASSLILFISLSIQGCAQKNPQGKLPAKEKADLSTKAEATFASGCFWCVEGVYESVKGVEEAVSGYSGGKSSNPTYEEVGAGNTDHAEAVTVYYDPAVVSYQTLLKVYFASQDPTQVNGQGPDKGRQYRSIIFYRNASEKQQALDYIKQLNASGRYKAPIAAEVVPFEKFWKAEDYHQDYIRHNPDVSYVKFESIPRIRKFQQQYPDLIKKGYLY
jgi:peptide-methionine (S)-S-oxide reductase